MPHFPTHNPLKKELNLENIYQKLPIGIELYDKESNLIDTTNEININPAKRKAMVAKNEKRFLKQKRNVLQKSESLSFRSDYPVKIQTSFKRLLKAV